MRPMERRRPLLFQSTAGRGLLALGKLWGVCALKRMHAGETRGFGESGAEGRLSFCCLCCLFSFSLSFSLFARRCCDDSHSADAVVHSAATSRGERRAGAAWLSMQA